MGLKKEIIEIGKLLGEKRLAIATSGNISIRENSCMYITSSGSCLYNLELDDIIEINLQDKSIKSVSSTKKPSSEIILHTKIYQKRPEITAIIHSHPTALCTLASINQPLNQPFLAEYVLQFDSIPIVNYAMPSSVDVAESTSEKLINNNVVIMQNHGVTCIAENLYKAFYLLETAEQYAQIYLNTKLLGISEPLSQNQVNEIKEKILK